MKPLLPILLLLLIASCDDNDTFTVDTAARLRFERDTISLDTVFSRIATPARSFMVHNTGTAGLRIPSVSLAKGQQLSGFRVNVDGSYLAPEENNTISDLELRAGDSLRVYVELTSPRFNGTNTPVLWDDDLLFRLESGATQSVNLRAYTWDADTLRRHRYTADATIGGAAGRPIIVYDTLTVAQGTTLTLAPGTTLYFHDGAALRVDGTLRAHGTAADEITLRCDRLDSLTNIPYDRAPGMWGGLRFTPTATASSLDHVNIRGTQTAIRADSTDLTLRHTTITAADGYGIRATDSRLTIENTEISNTYRDCLYLNGGNVHINACTIAQYYAYNVYGQRALFFTDSIAPLTLHVASTLITGYGVHSDDEVWLSPARTDSAMAGVRFEHSVLRTAVPAPPYDTMFAATNTYLTAADTLAPQNAYRLFDTRTFRYDFTPTTLSPCYQAADPATAPADDRRGTPRHTDKPSIGCYEPLRE